LLLQLFAAALLFSPAAVDDAAAAGYTLNADPLSVQPGQNITVTWTTPSTNSRDWIAWSKIGDSNYSFDPSRWRYTFGAPTGSMTITAPATPGSYEFRYLVNDGYNSAVHSQTVTVNGTIAPPVTSPVAYNLSVSSTSTGAGQNITVSWTSPGGNSKDWIGWFKSGDANTGFDPGRWRYTNGAASGSVTIPAAMVAGSYEFRYLLNDGFTDVARSNPVAVTAAVSNPPVNVPPVTTPPVLVPPVVAAPSVVFSVNPQSVAQGQTARLSWSSATADACAASGGWSGAKGAAGAEDVLANVTTTFTIVCSGAAGSAFQNVTLNVTVASGGRFFYVATNGDDRNPGTVAQPFGTLKKAIGALKPGDTLFVRGGEYDTVNGLSNGPNSAIPSGSSWDQPVTIKAFPGEKPVFRRYVPQGSRYTEDQIRSGGHMPTFAECAAIGAASNYPWNCWQGGTEAGGLSEIFTYGTVGGYVIVMDNDDPNPSQYIIFDGIDFDGRGITNTVHFYSGARHIRFQNGEIRNSIQSCVAQQASSQLIDTDLQFINMKIHHCGVPYDTNMINGTLARKHPAARYRHPWYMHSGGNWLVNSETYESAGTGLGPDGNNNVVIGNYIHDNSAQGIYIAGGNNWTICNNVFYNNGTVEIYHYSGGNHTICNNTIVAGPNEDVNLTGMFSNGVLLHNASWGSLYQNNIIDGFYYGVYNISWGAASTFSNNLIRNKPAGNAAFFNPGGTPTINQNNLLNRNPGFVNPNVNDFHLAAGSPAIDAGKPVANLTTDIEGKPRPGGGAFDLGAYEY
jgi:hypothetical protein